MRQVQQPVLERGGNRARGGTLGPTVPRWPLRLELAEEERSSLGAMIGNRSACFLEESPRLSSCITSVLVEVMRDLVQAETGKWDMDSNAHVKTAGISCRRIGLAQCAMWPVEGEGEGEAGGAGRRFRRDRLQEARGEMESRSRR